MKTYRAGALIAAVGAFLGVFIAVPGLRADDSPLDVSVVVSTENQSKDVTSQQEGSGQEKVTRPEYTAVLHNNGMDAVANIR